MGSSVKSATQKKGSFFPWSETQAPGRITRDNGNGTYDVAFDGRKNTVAGVPEAHITKEKGPAAGQLARNAPLELHEAEPVERRDENRLHKDDRV